MNLVQESVDEVDCDYCDKPSTKVLKGPNVCYMCGNEIRFCDDCFKQAHAELISHVTKE